MLTPSGVTLQEYIDAVKADKPSHVRITFIGQNVVLTDSDIESSGIKMNHYLNGDTALIMGKAVMANITVPIIHTSKVDDLIWNGEFKFEIGQEINSNTTEWITIGYFSGKRPEKVNSIDVIDFTANDRMSRFDRLADKWIATLTFPMTLQGIFQSLCTYCGVQYVSGDELPIMFARSFSQSPFLYENKTCRDILAQIAEACGCYAKITADGKCKLVWFDDHTSDYTLTEDVEFPPVQIFDHMDGKTWEELETLTWEDLETLRWSDLGGTKNLFRIDSITLVNTVGNYEYEYPGQNGNVYTIVDNPFILISNGTDINNYLKPIMDRFTTFGGYIPLTVDCVGCALIEAGDIINVITGGETFATPIFCKQTLWNGSLTDEYETTGEMNRAEVDEANMVKLSESARYKLVMGQVNLIAQGKYDIQSNIDILPEGISVTGSKYIKISSGGTFDVDSTNFKISSDNKLLKTGNWQFDDDGLKYDVSAGSYFVIGSKTPQVVGNSGIRLVPSGANFKLCFDYTWNGSILETAQASFEPSYFASGSRPQWTLNIQRVVLYNGLMPITDNQGTIGGYDSNLNLYAFKTAYIHDIYGTVHAISSRKKKHNIKPLKSFGDEIDKLNPVSFVYDFDTKELTRYGLIYEEAVEVLPDICEEDEYDKSIKYMELIPVLLKEVQELRKRVAELEAKIERGD